MTTSNRRAKIKFALAALTLVGLCLNAAEKGISREASDLNARPSAEKKPLKVFILSGQSNMQASVSLAKSLNATGTQNPTSDPNWFYYYKDQYGGGYEYGGAGASSALLGRNNDSDITIRDTAYTGKKYIKTSVVNNQTTAEGWSAKYEYYQYFVGVVEHEREHNQNQVPSTDPSDTDDDNLPSSYETSNTNTDPDDTYSAEGDNFPGGGAGFVDGEVYAGGPVEESGVTSASTSVDWARPGSQW